MQRWNDQMKIGILGISPGAGAGFLCVCLAKALVAAGGGKGRAGAAATAAVLELGNGGLYERLAMDKRFAEGGYFDFHGAAAADRSVRGRGNWSGGINWMLRNDAIELDLCQRMRLLHNAEGDFVFCRLSGVPEEELRRLLPEMDRVVAVVDPLPSALLQGYGQLCELRGSELPVTYVVNKMNAGVDRRQLHAFLNLGRPLEVLMLPAEVLYAAEYAGRTVYDLPNGRAALEPGCAAVLETLLGRRPGKS